MGKSWAVLLADYDVLAGRIWTLVPVTLLVAPLVADDTSGSEPDTGGEPWIAAELV